MRSVWCRSFASYVGWLIFYQKKPLPFSLAQLTLSQPSMVPEAKPDVVHHPYWPRNLELQNYIPNDRPSWQILTFVFSTSGILLLLTWFVASWRSKTWGPFGTWCTLIIGWFTICALIHVVIEGWFSLYYLEIPGDQSILSQLCHIYGDVLYFYTEYRDGFRHSEKWHPTYFWFYFVFLNSLWIIIPSILTWDAWKHLSACQRIMDANKVKKH